MYYEYIFMKSVLNIVKSKSLVDFEALRTVFYSHCLFFTAFKQCINI